MAEFYFLGHAESLKLCRDPQESATLKSPAPHTKTSKELERQKAAKSDKRRESTSGVGRSRNHEGHHQSSQSKVSNGDDMIGDVIRDERDNAPSRSLWVGNTFQGIKASQLRATFDKYGAVESVKPMANFSFVNFEAVESAISAWRDLNNKAVYQRGSPLFIRFTGSETQAKQAKDETTRRKIPSATKVQVAQSEKSQVSIKTRVSSQQVSIEWPNGPPPVGPKSRHREVSPPPLRGDSYRPSDANRPYKRRSSDNYHPRLDSKHSDKTHRYRGRHGSDTYRPSHKRQFSRRSRSLSESDSDCGSHISRLRENSYHRASQSPVGWTPSTRCKEAIAGMAAYQSQDANGKPQSIINVCAPKSNSNPDIESGASLSFDAESFERFPCTSPVPVDDDAYSPRSHISFNEQIDDQNKVRAGKLETSLLNTKFETDGSIGAFEDISFSGSTAIPSNKRLRVEKDETCSTISEVTSTASSSRRRRCMDCKKPGSDLSPLTTCCTCSARFHSSCGDPRPSSSTDGLNYVCGRCIQKQRLHSGTAPESVVDDSLQLASPPLSHNYNDSNVPASRHQRLEIETNTQSHELSLQICTPQADTVEPQSKTLSSHLDDRGSARTTANVFDFSGHKGTSSDHFGRHQQSQIKEQAESKTRNIQQPHINGVRTFSGQSSLSTPLPTPIEPSTSNVFSNSFGHHPESYSPLLSPLEPRRPALELQSNSTTRERHGTKNSQAEVRSPTPHDYERFDMPSGAVESQKFGQPLTESHSFVTLNSAESGSMSQTVSMDKSQQAQASVCINSTLDPRRNRLATELDVLHNAQSDIRVEPNKTEPHSVQAKNCENEARTKAGSRAKTCKICLKIVFNDVICRTCKEKEAMAKTQQDSTAVPLLKSPTDVEMLEDASNIVTRDFEKAFDKLDETSKPKAAKLPMKRSAGEEGLFIRNVRPKLNVMFANLRNSSLHPRSLQDSTRLAIKSTLATEAVVTPTIEQLTMEAREQKKKPSPISSPTVFDTESTLVHSHKDNPQPDPDDSDVVPGLNSKDNSSESCNPLVQNRCNQVDSVIVAPPPSEREDENSSDDDDALDIPYKPSSQSSLKTVEVVQNPEPQPISPHRPISRPSQVRKACRQCNAKHKKCLHNAEEITASHRIAQEDMPEGCKNVENTVVAEASLRETVSRQPEASLLVCPRCRRGHKKCLHNAKGLLDPRKCLVYMQHKHSKPDDRSKAEWEDIVRIASLVDGFNSATGGNQSHHTVLDDKSINQAELNTIDHSSNSYGSVCSSEEYPLVDQIATIQDTSKQPQLIELPMSECLISPTTAASPNVQLHGNQGAWTEEDNIRHINDLKRSGVLFESESETDDELEYDDRTIYNDCGPYNPLHRPQSSRNLYDICPELHPSLLQMQQSRKPGVHPFREQPAEHRSLGKRKVEWKYLRARQLAERRLRFGNPHWEVDRRKPEALVKATVDRVLPGRDETIPVVQTKEEMITFREFLGVPKVAAACLMTDGKTLAFRDASVDTSLKWSATFTRGFGRRPADDDRLPIDDR